MASDRNVVNFVVGFSGERVNPGIVMPYVRPALVDIYANSAPPWNAVRKWCTMDDTILRHTPVVYIDRDSDQHVLGLQLVKSVAIAHPWGFLPRCNNPSCSARAGDVIGRESKNKAQAGAHAAMRFKCQACGFGVWVLRPAWINPIDNTGSHFFRMPWPLTREEMDHAIGLDRKWELIREGGVAKDQKQARVSTSSAPRGIMPSKKRKRSGNK